jgi:SepF-like predicted cell division protein (DUF552 family)
MITRQLKRDFGNPDASKSGKDKKNVKYFTLEEAKDIEQAINDVRKGHVVILNINPLYKKNKQELKAVLSKLKGTCNALGGNVGLTFNNHVIATSSDAKIFGK